MGVIEVPEFDPTRHPPGLVKYFYDHRRRWEQGKIRLKDFAQQTFKGHDGVHRRLWYAEPLGLKVVVDKAAIFQEIAYRPSQPACHAHASLAKVRVFSGGARAGKSKWAGMEMLPILLSPATNQWIVAPEYEQGRKEFEYVLEAMENEELRKHYGPMLKRGRVRNNPKNGDMEIRLNWGGTVESFVKVKSAERKRSLLSEELDMVTVVEASQIPSEIWSRYLQMRLTTREGVAIFPSSPDGLGWFNDLYIAGMSGAGGCFSINCDSRMNPTMSLEELAFWTDPRLMSDEDFDEQVRGKPTPKHGRVYKNFDREIHCRSWKKNWPPQGAKKGRAFDFGYNDPYVILWIAKHGEAFYVYREFYKKHQLTDDVVTFLAEAEKRRLIQSEAGHYNLEATEETEKIDLATVTDWDASERADLWRRGIRTRRAIKDVLPGIRTVEEYLRLDDNGKTRLYINPACRNLIREFEVYEWGPNNQPKDKDDHGMDALRYFLHTLAPMRRSMEVRVV